MTDIKNAVKVKYRIGDMNAEVKTKPYNKFIAMMSDYEDNGKSDFAVEISDEEINCQRKEMNGEKTHRGVACQLVLLRKIAKKLPKIHSFLLHSVCIDIDSTGVAFSALSGTGKSTHLANWWRYLNGTENMPKSLKNLLKDKETARVKDETLPDLTIVNGDKPIVRFFDEEFCKEKGLEIPEGTEFGAPYAYGTPWNGKENLGCNMRTKIKHICFIERSETNFVTKIDKKEAVERIMKQVYMPKDPIALAKTLKLVDRLINSCELWIIHCNMEPESAKIAYDVIFNNE